jgi:hypothetical protein
MKLKYLDWFGNESNYALLSETYGLETAATLKNKSLSETLKPKECATVLNQTSQIASSKPGAEWF